MGYSELIKNFGKIREYMRQFYVYGFRSRGEYSDKSPRTYDNEKRRVESYLSEYMAFKRTQGGKNVFISLDTSLIETNPLYRALKSKSFTDGDITLHFIIFDILADNCALTLKEMLLHIEDDYLSRFETGITFDESTVRKKLAEYAELGVIEVQKTGKTVKYSLARSGIELAVWSFALQFFSEISPLGFLGNTLIDKLPGSEGSFLFKHHYITHALDSEETLVLLDAICQRRYVKIDSYNRHRRTTETKKLLPFKLLISAESGRRYISGYCQDIKNYMSLRVDYILSAEIAEEAEADEYERLLLEFAELRSHCWGVNLRRKQLEHVEFTIYAAKNEQYIVNRLYREKRIGTVQRLDKDHYVFKADVSDTNEMSPWIKTFIGRITQFNFSNRSIENRIKNDIAQMGKNYGIKGMKL